MSSPRWAPGTRVLGAAVTAGTVAGDARVAAAADGVATAIATVTAGTTADWAQERRHR